MNERNYTSIDRLLMAVDNGVQTVFGNPQVSGRPDPADVCVENNLSEAEKQLSARLMRINHAGEVSAQALYQGQALTAKLPEVREENDHLAWCEKRAHDLDSHVSIFNPLWYGGSLVIGALAGLAGDKWSLGFIVETEHQVIRHLDEHLEQLPEKDDKSRAILEQMKEDEAHHATTALNAGGAPLPEPVKKLMGLTSKIMTRTAYWI